MTTGRHERIIPDSRRALARLISEVERGGPSADQLMRRLGAQPARSWVVGVTGPPGSGKSTLVDCLTSVARAEGLSVGIVAVDPTSPFSGGAILGDRVRMLGHSGDPGVFIRSMAARDSLGGLAPGSRDVVRVLDAYGFDLVILETVGVGQTELDVVRVADSVVVVAVPGLGDAVQALKAGILEIADLIVVNMADRPGADRTVAELEAMLHIGPSQTWTPPVLQTVATEERGIAEVWDALQGHRRQLEQSGDLVERRRQRVETEVIELVERELRRRITRQIRVDGRLAQVLDDAKNERLDPHTAAARIIDRVVGRQ